MGGLGSGRWRSQRCETVESHRWLDVSQLSTMGCLSPGWSGDCQWDDDNELAAINLRAEANRLHLLYRVRIDDGNWTKVADVIPILRVPCRFGGSRAYFVCPGIGNGECGRRVVKIYGPNPYFRCRHCYQLPYASQYERALERALRRVKGIKQRFSAYVGVAASLPEKPRGMWVRSYERLLEQTLEAEMRLEEARTNQVRRLLAQLENLK